MSGETELVPAGDIGSLIRTVRGQKVILDSDLARVFGVPAKRLNEQVSATPAGSRQTSCSG